MEKVFELKLVSSRHIHVQTLNIKTHIRVLASIPRKTIYTIVCLPLYNCGYRSVVHRYPLSIQPIEH